MYNSICSVNESSYFLFFSPNAETVFSNSKESTKAMLQKNLQYKQIKHFL